MISSHFSPPFSSGISQQSPGDHCLQLLNLKAMLHNDLRKSTGKSQGETSGVSRGLRLALKSVEHRGED